MAKTFKQLQRELNSREEEKMIADLLESSPFTDEELEELAEGSKFNAGLKIIATGMMAKLASASRRVLSASTTDSKIDELAKAVAIAGSLAGITIITSSGKTNGASKIAGLAKIK